MLYSGMKKIFGFIILLICFITPAKADHITGGEMFYSFAGVSNGQYTYNVTLKLFMRCNSGRSFNDPTIISIFNKSTNSRHSDTRVPLTRSETLQLNNTNRCITNPPVVCFLVGYYEFSITVPASPDGYVITGQVNYRVAGIKNLVSSYNAIGATYTAEIPGTSNGTATVQNNSARFVGSDLVVICAGSAFSYSFAADDNDRDERRYSFCEAYQSGTSGGPNTSNPPVAPPYQPVPYSLVYNGGNPLGNNTRIDPNTGLITGIAPSEAGNYVVTVCVSEIRNGVVIATQRKDIQINVAPCTIAGAKLQQEYMLCRNTKTITLSNQSFSPLIVSQYWELSNIQGAVLFTSTDPSVTYTFTDTGTYNIKLVVNRGKECSDSTTSLARVYPGFVPDFSATGICYKKPTVFKDATSSVYGTVQWLHWDFGEYDISADTSRAGMPVYTYAALGQKNVRLIAASTVGCIDTIIKSVTIVEKPPLSLAFRDTLICVKDDVQLKATGNGTFSWTPALNILNANVVDPKVSPSVTTTYFVVLDDDGCINRDSVKVNVIDRVNLTLMNDTTICRGDTVQLKIVSDAFKYSWVPAVQTLNAAVKNPLVVTNTTTSYEVTASIGSCIARGRIAVKTVPYPYVNAGADTTICYNSHVQLKGNTDGFSFNWTPGALLNNSTVLNPLTRLQRTTSFILKGYDTQGCPKPGIDTVLVKVLPTIYAFAGRDTSVITGQSLQLRATGGLRYTWLPATGLSDAGIAAPVAIHYQPNEGLRYKVLVYNEAQCIDSAFITVKVFKTLPSVFVPNAFTPNGDGSNDLLKPVIAGMERIEYFRIFNRWGQQVFSAANGRGWDGKVGGKLQDPGIFVWMVKAMDYKGQPYFKKGTIMLIL